MFIAAPAAAYVRVAQEDGAPRGREGQGVGLVDHQLSYFQPPKNLMVPVNVRLEI